MILNDLPWKQSKQTNQVHSVIFEIASKFCRDMLSKSLIQFSVDGWGCVVSLLFGLRPNCWPMPPPETPGHSQVSLTQCLVWTLLFSPGSWCTQGLVCALQESVSSVLWKFWYQIPHKIPWGFSVPWPDPQFEKSVVGPRTFLTVQKFLWYNCSAVCGTCAQRLYGR